MHAFQVDDDLKPNTKLYRYMRIETFMSSVEAKQIHLTNVNLWDDKWEVILSKIPTVDDEGRPDPPLYSFHQDIYGQCWSLVQESDAMWRIYSPSRTGVQIASSVEKFKLIGGVNRSYLGKVIYFETVSNLLEKASSHKSPFDDALFKRIAFEHEREVRFLTHGDFLDQFEPEWTYVSLPVDPSIFIESITIDPRADDWYVDTIARYCERIGLAAKPIKSSLYESDPHLKLGLVKQYVKVNDG
jgi:hypothetical protein